MILQIWNINYFKLKQNIKDKFRISEKYIKNKFLKQLFMNNKLLI